MKILLTSAALSLALALLMAAPAFSDGGRTVLVTVDDLPLTTRGLHPDADDRVRVTRGLLDVLERHGIRAVGLVTWGNVQDETDRELLAMWLAAGHELGNHSYRHLNYTATATETYIADVESARRELAAFLAEHGRTPRFFRFPQLREGETRAKLEAMRAYLKESDQRNLPVTLDNSDWSFARPWLTAQRRGDAAETARIAVDYHESLRLSIRHHEAVGDRLFERPLPQILLLHAFEMGIEEWDALFTWMKARGYRFAPADEVLADPVFSEPHAFVGPRGFGLWDRLLVERGHAEARREAEELLARQAAAWNRGDQEAFCDEYTDDVLFVAPTGLRRGRSEVLERYRQKYPDRASQGDLEFEIIDSEPLDGVEISMVGDSRPGRVHALTLVARWTLRYPADPSRETASGHTLLVLRRFADGWKIVRDASM